jgi:UDP:flavonoid glycosyltransferase YjiC (YdhE family)
VSRRPLPKARAPASLDRRQLKNLKRQILLRKERAAMRVLVTTWAWSSHYRPLVPMVWALQAAGHEVQVASQPRLSTVITDSGAVAVPVGPDLDHREVRAKAMGGLAFSSVPQPPAAAEEMVNWQPERRAKVAKVFGVFTAYSDAMLDDLLEYARWWRPDLVLFEPTTYAGPLVAAALGVPAVRHTHGVDVQHQARDVVADLVAPLADRIGLSDVDLIGARTIDPCPPSMQVDSAVRREFIRYVPYNGPAVHPAWLQPPAKPRVCLTWGTSTSQLTSDGTFLPAKIIDWSRDLGLETVVCVTEKDAATLREHIGTEIPDVRIAENLPLHIVLPGCSAIVHQGGNGTLLTAVHFGVPQLALPQLPDQTFHCKQMVKTGAGRMLPAAEASAEAVRAELAKVLYGAECADAAGRLRAEMRAQPAPGEVVDRLEQLANR